MASRQKEIVLKIALLTATSDSNSIHNARNKQMKSNLWLALKYGIWICWRPSLEYTGKEKNCLMNYLHIHKFYDEWKLLITMRIIFLFKNSNGCNDKIFMTFFKFFFILLSLHMSHLGFCSVKRVFQHTFLCSEVNHFQQSIIWLVELDSCSGNFIDCHFSCRS